MARDYVVRVADGPEDTEICLRLRDQAWGAHDTGAAHGLLPAALRPGSTTLIMETYGEPVATIRIEERTATSPLSIEEDLERAGTPQDAATVRTAVEEAHSRGRVGLIANWNSTPDRPRADSGLLLLGCAIKLCLTGGPHQVFAIAEPDAAPRRLLEKVANGVRVLRYLSPLSDTPVDLWRLDLASLSPYYRSFVDDATRNVLQPIEQVAEPGTGTEPSCR